MTMTSSRPYLVKALYEWMLDNHCTPQILVFADAEGVDVPRAHVKDGKIMLNIHPASVAHLLMDNAAISFNARFNRIATDIYIPMGAVIGIVARENGQGMMFDFAEPTSPPPPKNAPVNIKSVSKKPSLKVVK